MSESSTFCDHRIAPNNAKQWRTLPKVFQRRKGVKWNIRLNHFNFVCSMLLEYRTIVAMRNIKIIKLSYWNNPISKTYYFNIIWSYRKYFNWSSPYTDWNDVLKERKIFRSSVQEFLVIVNWFVIQFPSPHEFNLWFNLRLKPELLTFNFINCVLIQTQHDSCYTRKLLKLLMKIIKNYTNYSHCFFPNWFILQEVHWM